MTLIPFKRLNAIPLDFEVKCNNTLLSGNLILKERNLAELNGTITGSISISCDICAEIMEKPLNEKIHFYISDGIWNGSDEEVDVVEIEKSIIDMDELLQSEIELIRSDYFCCSQCEGVSLDKEF